MGERTSAGIMLYRRGSNPDMPLEVLLAHPGGPYFAKRDLGDWTIPKGEPDGRHEPLDAVARREFEEETGTAIDPAVPAIRLALRDRPVTKVALREVGPARVGEKDLEWSVGVGAAPVEQDPGAGSFAHGRPC